MLLAEETQTNVSIVAAHTVLTYTNDTDRDLTVLAKVEAGSTTRPIQGGSYYQLEALIDDAPISPNSSVAVPASVDFTVLQSRELLLEQGQTLVLKLTGLVGDTNVDVAAVLADATPAQLSEFVGSGAIPVDHNTGGADQLKIVDPDGVGVQDASLVAFLESDYTAGHRSSQYVRARTTTNVSGRWRNPMLLDTGNYILVIAKSNYQSRTFAITVGP